MHHIVNVDYTDLFETYNFVFPPWFQFSLSSWSRVHLSLPRFFSSSSSSSSHLCTLILPSRLSQLQLSPVRNGLLGGGNSGQSDFLSGGDAFNAPLEPMLYGGPHATRGRRRGHHRPQLSRNDALLATSSAATGRTSSGSSRNSSSYTKSTEFGGKQPRVHGRKGATLSGRWNSGNESRFGWGAWYRYMEILGWKDTPN